jgi:general secretion pathway protein D
MKTKNLKWKTCFIITLLFCVCAAVELQAQPRQGGGGGGGGFGGFGGGGFGGFGGGNVGGTASRGTTTSGQQYNPNGGIGSATIGIDPDSHNITVIADEETMATISKIIGDLDRPRPQVLIKVVFLEVQHSKDSDIGVEGGWNGPGGDGRKVNALNSFGLSGLNTVATNFNALGGTFSGAAVPTTGNAAGLYQLLGSDFQATLRAIAQAGNAQLLSRPSILARDSQPATIVIGQYVPLPTSVSFVGTSGTPVTGVTYTDVGIILRVTPFITGEGFVQMIVQPETSSVSPTETVPLGSGVVAPVIDRRAADTVVITPDGQTVVIGGLMRNDKSSTESKIPFLGDIPLLGNLFKRKTKSDAKTELMIFLTPHIVRTPQQLASMTDNERLHSLTPTSYSEQQLDHFLDKMPAKKQK